MRAALAVGFLVLAIVGGFLALDRTTLHWYSVASSGDPSTVDRDPPPTSTTTAAPKAAPTRRPSPTPGPPNRRNCYAIRGTPYLSAEERTWFLSNCMTTLPLPRQPIFESPVSEEPIYREREFCRPLYERYDSLRGECVPSSASCTDQEEYDFFRARCVPREPRPSDCGFDEEFDFIADRCVPRGERPSDCTFDEEYDFVRDRCVPR